MDEPTKTYIAGFLDGDGSIIAQLVKWPGYQFGFHVRVSVCFYQNTGHRDHLEWLQHTMNMGYIRDRDGNMSDYTIVAHKDVRWILTELQPYVRLKARHVMLALKILDALEQEIDAQGFLAIARKVDELAALNYSKKKKYDANVIRRTLESMGLLAPVTTDSLQDQR